MDKDQIFVRDYFSKFKGGWEMAEPAGETVLKSLEQIAHNVPASYIEFLKFSNGGHGSIPVSPGYFQLWSGEELAETNKTLQTQMLAQFAFGSSGGGCFYVFDVEQSNSPVYAADACSLDDSQKVSDTFIDFLQLFGKGEWDDGPTWE